MSRTEYLWIMGDDDEINPGSIQRVIECLATHPDYLVLNSNVYNRNLLKPSRNKVIKCNQDVEYGTGDSGLLFSNLSKRAYNGFMSSMVVRNSLIRSLISKYEDEKFSLFGNSWLMTALFYEAIWKRFGRFICSSLVKDGIILEEEV